MMFGRFAGPALAGVAIASLAASSVSAARYCWKSDGKTVCVDTGGGAKPVTCKTRPCVVTSGPGQGGNNRPALERPNGMAVAAKDDISIELDLKRFDAAKLAPGKLAQPTLMSAPH